MTFAGPVVGVHNRGSLSPVGISPSARRPPPPRRIRDVTPRKPPRQRRENRSVTFPARAGEMLAGASGTGVMALGRSDNWSGGHRAPVDQRSRGIRKDLPHRRRNGCSVHRNGSGNRQPDSKRGTGYTAGKRRYLRTRLTGRYERLPYPAARSGCVRLYRGHQMRSSG
jgi:hypothetical protein